MPIDKPFKTYHEQIKLIRSKNIIVNDEQFAERILKNLSYYTLINGYKKTFMSSNESDSFIDGTSIEILYTIHLLDNDLNSLIFKYILYIERSLKTKIAYLIGRNYGVCTHNDPVYQLIQTDYLSEKNYSNRHRSRSNILRDLNAAIVNCRSNSTTSYYRATKDHVPPWILVNDISFGLTITWYSILSAKDKSEICNELLPYPALSIEEKKEFLKISLDLLRKYRNGIAHGNKTFSHVINIQLPSNILLKILGTEILPKQEYRKGIGKNNLASIILLVMILVDDNYILRRFQNDLANILFPYIGEGSLFAGNTIFEVLGLSPSVIDRLKKFHSKLFSV